MPKSKAADELLTSTQVGQILNRSGRTVIRQAESGLIPIATKLPGPNGAYLFRRSDIDEFAKREAKAAS